MRRLDDRMIVAGQIAPADVAGLAAQGVTMIVNNRPDGEEPGQPLASDIERAASDAGIAYRFVPIVRGIGPSDIAAMAEAVRDSEGGEMLAFCRSGRRSALTWALARRSAGVAREEVEQRLAAAGFDTTAIAHLL